MTTIKNNDAHWSHGAWSPCKLAKGEQCGPGLMTRGIKTEMEKIFFYNLMYKL